jgi:hypothetical protein
VFAPPLTVPDQKSEGVGGEGVMGVRVRRGSSVIAQSLFIVLCALEMIQARRRGKGIV